MMLCPGNAAEGKDGGKDREEKESWQYDGSRPLKATAYFKDGKFNVGSADGKFRLWFDNRIYTDASFYIPTESVEGLTSKLNKDLEEDYKDDLANADKRPVGAWYSYYEMSSNTIAFNQADIISYTVSFENYTGGAHGAHAYNNHVLNLRTGRPITEEEIFVEDYQDSLARILVDRIARQNNLTDIKELEDIGFFSVDEIYPNGNFLVDEEGITYSFNEYEIAAYVVGVTNVRLPYQDIRHLLKDESPIAHLIDK